MILYEAEDVTLSVVIPFHSTPQSDRREMLKALVDTIPLRQDVEILVVDDRSSVEIPAEVQSRARLLRTEPGRCFAGAARNIGLAHAQGRFVVFADSDDLFDCPSLDRVITALAGAPGQEEAVVHLLPACEFISGPTTDQSNALYPAALNAEPGADVARLLLDWHAPWGKIFERKQFDGVSFEENQRVANDALFSARLAMRASRVSLACTKPAYFVRREHGAGALTSRKDADSIRMRIETFRKINSCVRASGRPDLVIPMHFPLREHFTAAPAVVCSEGIKSLLRGEAMLPARLSPCAWFKRRSA